MVRLAWAGAYCVATRTACNYYYYLHHYNQHSNTRLSYRPDALSVVQPMVSKQRSYKNTKSKLSMKGVLHEFNQMVNLRVNHLVKCRRVARDPNPRLKLI